MKVFYQDKELFAVDHIALHYIRLGIASYKQ